MKRLTSERRRGPVVWVLLAATAIVVSACGGGESSGTGTPGGDPPGTSVAATSFDELVRAAQAEGVVNWDTFQLDREAAGLIEGFEATYPGIKVNHRRQNSTAAQQAIQEQEIASGTEGFDLVSVSIVDELVGWVNQGRLLDLSSLPAYAEIPDNWKFGNGQIAGYYTVAMAMAYNTNLVSGDDIPKTYPDILQPKWDGLIGISDLNAATPFQIAAQLIEENSPGFMSRLGGLSPQVFGSSTQQAQALAAGQLAFTLYAPTSVMHGAFEEGAPIAVASVPDIPALLNVSGVYSKAQHPNAAKLFLNWMLSQDATDAFTVQTYLNPPALQINDLGQLSPILAGVSPNQYIYLPQGGLDEALIGRINSDLGT